MLLHLLLLLLSCFQADDAGRDAAGAILGRAFYDGHLLHARCLHDDTFHFLWCDTDALDVQLAVQATLHLEQAPTWSCRILNPPPEVARPVDEPAILRPCHELLGSQLGIAQVASRQEAAAEADLPHLPEPHRVQAIDQQVHVGSRHGLPCRSQGCCSSWVLLGRVSPGNAGSLRAAVHVVDAGRGPQQLLGSLANLQRQRCTAVHHMAQGRQAAAIPHKQLKYRSRGEEN
mmetsp:Transcript_53791/g.96846  ORF Transcript_53791/g.96846 Transcript_53791/m.96846 type:complete len:231 (-) Transcript_53791:1103-1795(-)